MQKVKPKKFLGQHFLNDTNIAKNIVDSMQCESVSTVIEIGPGMGVLTQFLLEQDNHFKAIEIDRDSVAFLKEKYPEKDFVVEGDFLKMDLSEFKSPIGIIGNFPYNISSQIFFKVLEKHSEVNEVVCMIQKEVAERIASPHGNKTFGILSVFLQTFYTIEYLFTVDEHCFNPPPKVKSAVIRLVRNSREQLPCDIAFYFRVVKQAFNQRRKTLRNSLKNICLNLDCTDEVFGKRPEQLDVEGFINLTVMLEQRISNRP